MEAARRDIQFTQGDGYTHVLTFEDADGPLDYSDLTFESQVRPEAGGELVVDFAVDDSDSDTGIVILTLDADDTVVLPRRCVWDVQGTPSGGDPITFIKGQVTVDRQTTR